MFTKSSLLDINDRPSIIRESEIAALFEAPADWPLLAVALQRLACACNVANLGQFGEVGDQLTHDMVSMAARSPVGPADLDVLMSGRRSQHPLWSLVTDSFELSDLALRMLAFELLLAMVEQRPVRKSLLMRARKFSMNPAPSDFKYVARIEKDVRNQCLRRQKSISPEILRANSQLRAAIAVEMSNRNPETRQCAGGVRTLPPELLREVALWLAGNGDVISCIAIIAFISGLNWDCAKLIAIAEGEQEQCHVASLGLSAGLLRIDLSESIPSARRRPGYEAVSPTLVRPLPLAVAERIRELCIRNPSARRIGDLMSGEPSTRLLIGDFGQRVSIAKFLASRGVAALAAGVRREIGAYCLGAFSLVAKTQHSYFTSTQSEISDGLSLIYAWLGWSDSGPYTQGKIRVGSTGTPSENSIRDLDAFHTQRAKQYHVGRRCTLESLLRFHNSFAIACTHRMAFCTLARAASTYQYRASDWDSKNWFGTLIDKRAGPFRSATPLPMPVILREQIDLWLSHLQALDRRLEKFGISDATEVRIHIKKVLNHEECALFFLVQPSGRIRLPGSSDVFADTGMKGDAYRHFLSNELRRTGLQSEVIEAISRHTVVHATVFSCDSTAPPACWLQQAAQALDAVASRLNMRPLTGLRGTVR